MKSKNIKYDINNPPPEGLIAQFRRELYPAIQKDINLDPSRYWDWWEVTYGWSIGKGMGRDESMEFAMWIKYNYKG